MNSIHLPNIVTIEVVLVTVVGLVRDFLLVSLATYYIIDKLHMKVGEFLFNSESSHNYSNLMRTISLYTVVVSLIAMFFIYLSGNRVFNLRIISYDVVTYAVISSFLTSLAEEMFVRIFLLGVLLYFFRGVKYSVALAIILSSLFWSLAHFLDGMILFKFIFLFVLGMLLGYLMYKKGIESCIIVHGLYDVVALLFLGGFK